MGSLSIRTIVAPALAPLVVSSAVVRCPRASVGSVAVAIATSVIRGSADATIRMGSRE